MKLNTYTNKVALVSFASLLLMVTLILLIPNLVSAHGGVSVAEEASEGNTKLIIGLVVAAVVVGVFWFTVIRKK